MTVTLATSAQGERVEVEACESRGGLAITPTYGADQHWSRYRITHLASGYGIGRFATLSKARRALTALLALSIDWTAAREVLANPDNAARVREAIGPYRVGP